jgi:hypothetical protein
MHFDINLYLFHMQFSVLNVNTRIYNELQI